MAAARQNGNGRANGHKRARPNARAVLPVQRQAFLDHLAQGWTIHASTQAAGIKRREAVYDLRGRDEAFADQWDAAVEAGVQVLEQEAIRRGVTGVEKPVYQGGVLVGHVTEYSDQLLTFMLKAKRPYLYRERHEHKHEHRGKIDLRLDRLTEDELLQLEQLLEKAEQ